MLTIMLIDMPFSNITMPSIALAQIRSVLRRQFGNDVSVQIIHVNHDCARFLGVEAYDYFCNSMEALNTGMGDWFFRHEAFPELPDNTELYRRRCFPQPNRARYFNSLIEKRYRLGSFLDGVIAQYGLDKAHIVGFTSMFMQNTASFAMARKLKQRNPDIITVMGGANCEFPMGEVIARHVKSVDFVFSGPALKNFPEFVKFALAGDLLQCHSIRGVFSSQSPARCGPDTMGEELDINTPMELEYDYFIRRLERYFPASHIQPVLPFETSRGCWWGQRAHCTFCGLNGASMAYRSMKPEAAIQQFNSLFRYAGKVTRLSAVDNILPKSYLQEVLPALETPANMEIFYEVKADLSEQDISVLAKSRVKKIQPGIESLFTPTLKLMKKGTTAFQNLKLLQLCARYEIQPVWNLLVGFPGEREETYRRYVDTLPLLFHLPPPSGVFPVRFDRFSPYHTRAGEYGLDLYPMDFYSLVYPFSDADLNNFAYYFNDRNPNAEYRVEMVKWLAPMRERVEAWHARWNHSGRVRPRLYWAEGRGKIYDSRSLSTVEHQLGETASLVLERLSIPLAVPELIRQLAVELGRDVSNEVAELEEKGLVFRENDRMLSLVLKENPPTMLPTAVMEKRMRVAGGIAGLQPAT